MSDGRNDYTEPPTRSERHHACLVILGRVEQLLRSLVGAKKVRRHGCCVEEVLGVPVRLTVYPSYDERGRPDLTRLEARWLTAGGPVAVRPCQGAEEQIAAAVARDARARAGHADLFEGQS